MYLSALLLIEGLILSWSRAPEDPLIGVAPWVALYKCIVVYIATSTIQTIEINICIWRTVPTRRKNADKCSL